jgi:hypothetical protein
VGRESQRTTIQCGILFSITSTCICLRDDILLGLIDELALSSALSSSFVEIHTFVLIVTNKQGKNKMFGIYSDIRHVTSADSTYPLQHTERRCQVDDT